MKKNISNLYESIVDQLKGTFGLFIFIGGIIVLILMLASVFSLVTTGRLPKSSDFSANQDDNSSCEGPAYMGDNCP